MNAQPRKTAVRSRRLHSLYAAETQPAASALKLGTVSDTASVQRALSVVLDAVAAGTLDPARARVLLYGLQIAATNAHRMAAIAKQTQAAPPAEQAGADAPAVIETATATQRQQPEIRGEERDNAMDEPAAADWNEDESVQAAAETPTQTDVCAEQDPAPSASLNTAPAYSNRNRERLLSFKARSQGSIV